MRKVRKSLLAFAASSALALGLCPVPAQAAEASPSGATDTQVHAWTYADVHTGPNTYSTVLSHVANGYTYSTRPAAGPTGRRSPTRATPAANGC